MNRAVTVAAIFACFLPLTAQAQPVADGPRRVVFGDIGYARTLDDEGLLGSGLSAAIGVGYRFTPRLTVQAIVERIRYYRDVEWLTFDGRVLFAGVEAAFQSRRQSIRPLATVGIGLFDDEGVWITKRHVAPRQPRVEERINRSHRLAAMTASGGIDYRVSARGSIRASLRFHGLLDTGDDLAPHIILHPSIGFAWRW